MKEIITAPRVEIPEGEYDFLDLLPDSSHYFKPALDYVDGVLYVTLPWQRGDGKLEGIVVTSERGSFPFPLCFRELKRRGLMLSNALVAKPTKKGEMPQILAPAITGRWSTKRVKEFYPNSQEQLNLRTEDVGRILGQHQVFAHSPRRKWVVLNGKKVQRTCYWFNQEKLQAWVKPLFDDMETSAL